MGGEAGCGTLLSGTSAPSWFLVVGVVAWEACVIGIAMGGCCGVGSLTIGRSMRVVVWTVHGGRSAKLVSGSWKWLALGIRGKLSNKRKRRATYDNVVY